MAMRYYGKGYGTGRRIWKPFANHNVIPKHQHQQQHQQQQRHKSYRVLALHGERQSGAAFVQQITHLFPECVTLWAPTASTWFVKGKPADENIKILDNLWQSHRFDIVIGFNQGASMAYEFAKRHGVSHAIFLHGSVPDFGLNQLAKQEDDKPMLLHHTNTIHVIGLHDPHKDDSERLWKMCDGLSRSRIRLTHAHRMIPPPFTFVANTIRDTLQKAIHSPCNPPHIRLI